MSDASYNTNIDTWSASATTDFFAFKGEGGMTISQSFGDVSGAIRKYDLEDAIVFQLKKDVINSNIDSTKNARFDKNTVSLSYADISGNGMDVVGMGSRFKKIYKDFVGEVQTYFGIVPLTWDISNISLLFDLPTSTLIFNRTNETGKLGELKTDGFKALIQNSTTTTCNLRVDDLLKNFENAYKTNVFANASLTTNPDRRTQFCVDDLIYFKDGITVRFNVNLFDNSGSNVYNNGVNVPIANNSVDYINSVINTTYSGLGGDRSNVNSDGITTTSTTTIGEFSTTSTVTATTLSKTYKAPLVIRIVA